MPKEIIFPRTSLTDVSQWNVLDKTQYASRYPFLVNRNNLKLFEHWGHAYLFKFARSTKGGIAHHNIWMEFIASYIGEMLKVDVPKTWLAVDKKATRDYYGVLTRWFYNIRDGDQKTEAGGTILQELIPNYNRKEHHNVKTILEYAHSVGIRGAKKTWAKILLFDLIIDNGDRHDGNWEVIHTKRGKKFGPAFDNSLSLLWNDYEKRIVNWTRDHPLHWIVRRLYFHRKAKRFRLNLRPALDAKRFTIKQTLTYIIQHNMLTSKQVLDVLARLDLAKLGAYIRTSRREMNPFLASEHRLDSRVATLIIAFLKHRKVLLVNVVRSMRTDKV